MKCSVLATFLCGAFAFFQPAPLHAQPAVLGLRNPLQQPVQQNDSRTPANGDVGLRTPFPVNPQPPAILVLPIGTIITVEASEILSSDKQHAGDNFVAELQSPLVVDGWVVARPGQTVVGRVAKAKKAGRVKGTSRLSLELQQIVLADGRQTPVKSDVVENSGPTSHARDVAAVALTTGVGAAIGAVCGAKSAAIGAAAGAAAGIGGVLLTRGESVEIGTEKLLTFRLASPVTVSTGESQHVFWQVTADDYIVQEKVITRPRSGPAPVIVSQPGPRHVPVSVWPESEGLAVGRPGRPECGGR